MESVPFWLTHYGYAGLSVLLMLGIIGLPIPDETLLAFVASCPWWTPLKRCRHEIDGLTSAPQHFAAE